MREVFSNALNAWRANLPFALATLVARQDAAAAEIGTSMAVSIDGGIDGDVGAGCYESDIVEAARLTAVDGISRLLQIDLSGDDLISGGTGCGGRLEVVTWRPVLGFDKFARSACAGVVDSEIDISYERDRIAQTFRLCVVRRRVCVIVGATVLANEIAAFLQRLDVRTIVVDPRAAFATAERLQAVDEILVKWPDDVLPRLLDDKTPLLVVSHDPKIDLPALRCGLRSRAPYVGLLGSRRAQRSRRDALLADGFEADEVERIQGPAGLDLGGVTVPETALSIVAEVVAKSRGGSGTPLSATERPIHRRDDRMGALV
ncbi:MAG TPA: XdhC family protein [Candidatus Tumulicola sp.]